jgi:hypothetical protein
MSSAFPLHRYTYQDYVWLEEESSTRHEFLDGEIPTLEAFVIVSHREPRVDVWSRPAGSSAWSLATASAGHTALLPTLDCTLNVDAIWKAAAEPA